MDKTTVVPDEFLCPISLEIMKDPVIASSGVTYDRSSIESWTSSGGASCPITMQPLGCGPGGSGARYLVPNLALRRLIRSWCEKNKRSPPRGSRSPSPDIVSRDRAAELVHSLRRHDPGPALREIRSRARESQRSSRVLAEAGAVPAIAAVLSDEARSFPYREEAVRALALLPFGGDGTRRTLVAPRALGSISKVLRDGSPQGKVAAAALLESLARDRGAQIAICATPGALDGLIAMLRYRGREQTSLATTALRALLTVCASTRNRAAAAAGGAVAALVELLPEADGAMAEHSLMVLELLCSCDEGRAAASSHALAVPVIVKKMLRVSDSATEHAIGVLWSICCSSGSDASEVRQRTRGLGLFGKLLLLLRRDMGPGTRRKVIDILDKVYNAKMEYDTIVAD